jgi:hypothetical protein
MNIFDKMANGWEISKLSFKVLKANKNLIIFPILSGISLMIILGMFFVGIASAYGWDFDNIELGSTSLLYKYGLIFICYLINYFVVVFFNMALMHCAKLYFQGEEVTVAKGLEFSRSRIGAILSWSVFAATVGLVLKIIQDNVGWIGKIITGLIGIVWSVATFFTVPILAYENGTPWQALKKSSQMMKEKWGESLGATFSFGLIQFVAFILLLIPAFLIGYINVLAGIAVGIVGVVLIAATFSALNSIFVSAVYNKVKNDIDVHLNDAMFDTLFEVK